ncbi:type IV pilus assembly protein PilM [Kingella kingae]|uniref:Type IV pilus assembly protein PilM n=2 Tax=Kingella kingae TaxID=504 RepID=F5S5N2_KINKI|nr:type IV pilus assembly protein PilM [Kingella kingae]ACF19894.1 PilM [Kingella kingae]EGK11003.1 type IV pilus assembly protein PilM [Kingella kingae ATCC 23330]MDK4525549.1 type IV pilus assembly protein PilM [Kingella kingae]MDK4531532.1 type IV pilus assembly protein PilM [Kingella kingae]MDK4533843.1 type IV pilus assembly protein PilM [Kingella kingae]
MRFKKTEKNTSNKAANATSGRSVIGLDIGQGGIRMVQLSGRSLSQVQLEKYAMVTLPSNVISGTEVVDFEQLVSHLQQCYSKLKTNCKQVNISLPTSSVTIEDDVRFNPEESEISLQEMVESEVSRVGALDSMNYDWYEMSQNAKTGEQRILVVAAKTEDVDRCSDLLDEIGLQATNVDVDLFAIANAFAYADQGEQFADSKVLLVDVGDVNMRALVVEKGTILFRHESHLGLEQLVQLVQRNYQCGDAEALAMIYGEMGRPADYHNMITHDFNMQIAQEVQRALQFFLATQSMDQGNDIRQIFVSGVGCTGAAGLDDAIYAQTSIATQQIAPASLAVNKLKTDEARFAQDANSLTMAFGLALRGLV